MFIFDETSTCFDVVFCNRKFFDTDAFLFVLLLSYYLVVFLLFHHFLFDSCLLSIIVTEEIYCWFESIDCIWIDVIISLQIANFDILPLMFDNAVNLLTIFSPSIACVFNVSSFKPWISSFNFYLIRFEYSMLFLYISLTCIDRQHKNVSNFSILNYVFSFSFFKPRQGSLYFYQSLVFLCF